MHGHAVHDREIVGKYMVELKGWSNFIFSAHGNFFSRVKTRILTHFSASATLKHPGYHRFRCGKLFFHFFFFLNWGLFFKTKVFRSPSRLTCVRLEGSGICLCHQFGIRDLFSVTNPVRLYRKPPVFDDLINKSQKIWCLFLVHKVCCNLNSGY